MKILRENLSVKELAFKLGVSRHFVYQMRARGFPMAWDCDLRGYSTTEIEARTWLKATLFRLRDGRGVINQS